MAYDYVVCPICNKTFRRLSMHVIKVHKYQDTRAFLLDYPNTEMDCEEFLIRNTEANKKYGKMKSIEIV